MQGYHHVGIHNYMPHIERGRSLIVCMPRGEAKVHTCLLYMQGCMTEQVNITYVSLQQQGQHGPVHNRNTIEFALPTTETSWDVKLPTMSCKSTGYSRDTIFTTMLHHLCHLYLCTNAVTPGAHYALLATHNDITASFES